MIPVQLRFTLPKQVTSAVEGLKTGFKAGESIISEMAAQGNTDYTVFKNKKFLENLQQGAPAKSVRGPGGTSTVNPPRPPISFQKTPAEFLGAYAARVATDVGSKSTMMHWWRNNTAPAVADQLTEKTIDAHGIALSPTQKAVIASTVSLPFFVNTGTIDITNPGEFFRPKGYAQMHPELGAEDRRETAQPGLELFERLILQRQGQPLKYETAKEDIPSLTPQAYGESMRSYYQDKGLLGLGVLKGTTSNIQGVPEVRMLGFPVGIPAVTSLAGGVTGIKMAAAQPKARARNLAAGGLLGSLAGMAAGNVVNQVIAAVNRPKPPTQQEVYEQTGELAYPYEKNNVVYEPYVKNNSVYYG